MIEILESNAFDILLVPGWLGSGPNHWQTHWQRSILGAKSIDGVNWLTPELDNWVSVIVSEVRAFKRPVVIVAHSVGVIAVVHAARRLANGTVSGAFLVSPADVENAESWPVTDGHTWPQEGSSFVPIPREPLPFFGQVISSTNDDYCSQARAREFSSNWKISLKCVGAIGHITSATGHGPWPEGLKLLGEFLARLERQSQCMM